MRPTCLWAFNEAAPGKLRCRLRPDVTIQNVRRHNVDSNGSAQWTAVCDVLSMKHETFHRRTCRLLRRPIQTRPSVRDETKKRPGLRASRLVQKLNDWLVD
jgi:hypothetical protein